MFAEAIREWAIGPRCLYKLRSLLLATWSYACVLKCIRAKETTHDHWAVFYMFHVCLYWKMRDFTIAHISFLSKERLIFHHRNLMLCLNSAGAVLLVWGLQLLMFLLLLLILTLTSFIPGTANFSRASSLWCDKCGNPSWWKIKRNFWFALSQDSHIFKLPLCLVG